MAFPLSMIFDLIAVDKASPVFNRVAAAAAGAGTATEKSMLRISKAGAAMGVAGKKLSRSVTLPLLAIGAASVKAATDFQASMTRIQTQAGGSAKDVKLLSAQVLSLAKTAQQGPNELASALYHLKSVGLDNVGAMQALKTASDLASVGNADLEETTNALAGAWRTGIKGATDFHEAAATVNAVIGAGNMSLGDFTEALSTGILPSAKTFGLTLKDVGSALALFTDESVPANVAATRLRMTFSLMAAPSAAAEKQLNKIGLTGFQLGEDLRKPDGLITAVGDLKQHLDDAGLSGTAAAQLLSHAFGGGRSSSAILGMINNFDVLKQKQEQVTRSLGNYDKAVATQRETAAAKFHLALSSFQRAGVMIGTQLLPIATQIGTTLASVAEHFNGMSDGAKHFAVELGVGLLVLGPMLSLIGKLTKAIAFMWAAGRGAIVFTAGMRGATLATETMTSKAYLAGRGLSTMGRAAVGAGAAVAAIGVGFSIGRMTREASGGAKALGLLASVGTGAALGAGFGPAGVAVGGLVGGLSNLVGGMGGVDEASVTLNANISGLTDTLLKDGLVVGKLTSAYIAHQIAQSGVLDGAGALGLSYRTLTAAARGNKPALTQVALAMDSNNDAAIKAGQKIYALADALEKARGKAKAISGAFHVFGNDNRTLAAGADRNSEAISRMAAGSQDVAGAQHVEAAATQNLTASLKELTKQYLRTTNAALGIAQSENQFLDSLHSMRQAIKDSNGSLAQHTAKGRAAQEALEGAAQGALAMDDGTRKGNRSLLTHITNLRNAAIAAGADRGAVHDLLASLNLLPSQINMTLNVNTGASMAKLREIQNQVNAMHGKTLFVGVAGGHALPQNARGGGLPEGVSTVGERGFEVAIKRGKHVQILSNSQSKSFLGATGIKAPGFAGGTPGVHMPSARVSGVSPSSRGGTGRIVSGSLSLDVDSSGGLIALLRDVVIDEGDLDGTLGRMR